MSKVVILGIDGFDPLLVEKWIDYLPNFKEVRNKGSFFTIQSTFPPDSICAWASIFTGKNPAQHGLLESIDYLSEKKYKYAQGYNFEKDTFWDIASNCGKKVCIINPFLAYPAWKVNGVMVSGPVFEGGETTACPAEILDRFQFPSLGGWVDFPEEKELSAFIRKARENTTELAKVSLEMYKEEAPDLFFVTFLTSDRIQHFLWRFMDEGDPTHPGDNPFKDSIRELYILFDQVVGEFMEAIDNETFLLVISDHGHGRRCTHCLNLNEFLRKKRYLFTSTSGVSKSSKIFIEKMKVLILRNFHRFGLQDMMYKMARFVPNRKALKKASYLIDKDKSLAYTSELCSTNPFGGIEIKKGTNYEELRERVIEDIKGLNSHLKEDIVKWVKKREELYQGEYLHRYPDIIFELNDDYGVNWDLFVSLISENYTHRKISGGHKEKAVFAICPRIDESNIVLPTSIIEIKDFILGLLKR